MEKEPARVCRVILRKEGGSSIQIIRAPPRRVQAIRHPRSYCPESRTFGWNPAGPQPDRSQVLAFWGPPAEQFGSDTVLQLHSNRKKLVLPAFFRSGVPDLRRDSKTTVCQYKSVAFLFGPPPKECGGDTFPFFTAHRIFSTKSFRIHPEIGKPGRSSMSRSNRGTYSACLPGGCAS
jgi:hypothetical protein